MIIHEIATFIKWNGIISLWEISYQNLQMYMIFDRKYIFTELNWLNHFSWNCFACRLHFNLCGYVFIRIAPRCDLTASFVRLNHGPILELSIMSWKAAVPSMDVNTPYIDWKDKSTLLQFKFVCCALMLRSVIFLINSNRSYQFCP